MTGTRGLVTALLAVGLTAITFNVIGTAAITSTAGGTEARPIAGHIVSTALVSTEAIVRKMLLRLV